MENTTMNQLVTVMVENAYTATEEDELSLRPGDVIRNVERSPGGWWKGELRGRIGLFPDNFVRIMGPSDDPTNDQTLRNNSPRYCRALFSYQQANPDELSLAVGDVIQVLGEEEEGWWRGVRGSQRGVFPSNFVEPLDTAQAPPPCLPPKPIREYCQVLFPYTAANVDEISLEEGDVVAIVSREVQDQGWWRGELRGRIGLFPDNFVRLLPGPGAAGSGGDTGSRRPSRPIKNVATHKNQPTSTNRKDSTSSKSSIGSTHENVASVRKSLEATDNSSSDTSSLKAKKMDAAETGADGKGSKPRKSLEADSNSDTKSRKSLDVDSGGGKPPVPSKKAGSPVAAMLSGFKQKVLAVEHRLIGQPQQTLDVSDGVSSSKQSGEPILRSVSPSPTAVPAHHSSPAATTLPSAAPQIAPTGDNFDQVERSSLLNDPRAGRVKAPRRRPPSQVIRDDVPLTNGSTHSPAPAEVPEEIEIKPKAREWEKHRAPWMEELKLNQARKTSPIAEIGRSKTIAADSSNVEKTEMHHGRLSGSSDKILESGTTGTESEKGPAPNPLEMSQSMTALSSNAIKIETLEEVQSHTENPTDLTKSFSTIASRATHLETNNKVSSNELRTSISSTANVVLRSTTTPIQPSLIGRNSFDPSLLQTNKMASPVPVIRPISNLSHGDDTSQSSVGSKHTVNLLDSKLQDDKNEADPLLAKLLASSKEIHHKVLHSNGESSEMNGTPEQLLIAQLNERVANLERVVEAQEERFSAALSALNKQLHREAELRVSLQAELLKLERCVTRV